eukprot:COSAG03_NODE_8108_length_836_cov_1.565807_2_plen_27_part_01
MGGRYENSRPTPRPQWEEKLGQTIPRY